MSLLEQHGSSETRMMTNEDAAIDRGLLQNGATGNNNGTGECDSNSFCIQHLNEVFTVWDINKKPLDMNSQVCPHSSPTYELKQAKLKEKEKNNILGNTENESKNYDKNEEKSDNLNVKCDTAVASTSKVCQKAISPIHITPGKSKSAMKRRMKKLAAASRNETACPNEGSAHLEDQVHSVDTSRKSKNFLKKRNKKFEVEKCMESSDNVSSGLSECVKEFFNLKLLENSVSGTGVLGEPSLLHDLRHKVSEIHRSSNVKNKSQEFDKHNKITKRDVRKADGSTEAQQTKSKGKLVKFKSKGIVSNTTTSSKPLSSSENATPKKNSPKKQKNMKSFEPYWSLDAVKKGILNGSVIEGAIRINPKRFTDAYVSSPNGGQDILIDGISDRNRALEGDLVAVVLKSPSEWKVNKKGNDFSKVDASTSKINEKDDEIEDTCTESDSEHKSQVTGKVVAVLVKIHPRTCAGYLKSMKPLDKYAIFSPRDARIPRIRINCDKCPSEFRSNPSSKKSTLYLARILDWTSGTFALGEIVKQIGNTGDLEAETDAILLDNDLDVTPYAADVGAKFASLSDVGAEELSKREDLRKECIFTIDPSTAKDLDDAVSCKELDNGNFEIGVHISDVTHYLKENSDLDIEVSKRATSIYLVDKVYHMLPEQLCFLCSLLPGKDKVTYSVIWEISGDDAKILSQRIVRSVINSCAKLSYEHAQLMIENPEKQWDKEEFPDIENGFSLSDISKAINNLEKIAKILRSQRFENGALRIDQTKVYMKLDSSGMPTAVLKYISKESNRLIEEFMLLANMTTAKFIYTKFPDIAFLRCHPEPHQFPLRLLQDAMASRGIHLNITSAGDLQASLKRYSGDDFLSETRLIVLNMLCAKTMSLARYFCSGGVQEEEFWHYALSVPFYTHFTSPIRRYADIMVHRLLNAALDYCPKPLWTEDHVSQIASNCNKKKVSAKLAGEQSIKLYLSIFIKHHQPVIEDAVVVDVKDYSFDVIVCKYGLTMRVYTTKLDADVTSEPYQKLSPMEITWKPNENCSEHTVQVVDVFTIVKVSILCDESLKLEARLVRPENPKILDTGLDKT